MDKFLIKAIFIVLSAQSHLRLLDLSGNHITHLPNTVGELSKLKSLFLNQNRLGILPGTFLNLYCITFMNELFVCLEELCRLEKLEFLALAYNFLKNLPRNFSALENLRFRNVTKLFKINIKMYQFVILGNSN